MTLAKESGAQAIGHLSACDALRGSHALSARCMHVSVPRRGGGADDAPIAEESLMRVRDVPGTRS